jgi:hypothetical protein
MAYAVKDWPVLVTDMETEAPFVPLPGLVLLGVGRGGCLLICGDGMAVDGSGADWPRRCCWSSSLARTGALVGRVFGLSACLAFAPV